MKVYIVTTTFTTDEKNYEEGTTVEKVFFKKVDAEKLKTKLDKKYNKTLDECVNFEIEITSKKVI